jgi:phosphate transport system substrate-binding protein
MKGPAWGLSILLVMALTAGAGATGGGRIIAYGGGGEGKVIFDGRTHAAAGLRCGDCHPVLFQTRKLALIALEDHGTDRACFSCHNGKKAFADCAGCHRK